MGHRLWLPAVAIHRLGVIEIRLLSVLINLGHVRLTIVLFQFDCVLIIYRQYPLYSILVALADSSWSPLPVSEVVVCVAVVRHQSLADVHQKGR